MVYLPIKLFLYLQHLNKSNITKKGFIRIDLIKFSHKPLYISFKYIMT